MVEQIFALGFLENIKVLFVGILVWALIFAVLKKIDIFGGNDKVNSLLALLSAIIVSFSGVVTYAISYAINWFFIILFIVFLIMVFLMFLGVSGGEIAGLAKDNIKPLMVAMVLVFLVILTKGFFAVNNAHDLNDPIEDQYEIDASFNTGIDDITNQEIDGGSFFDSVGGIDSDLLSASLFLLVIGVFVMFVGKSD